MELDTRVSKVDDHSDSQHEDLGLSIRKILESIENIPTAREDYTCWSIEQLKTRISVELMTHLRKIGYLPDSEGLPLLRCASKDTLRRMQQHKRREQLRKNQPFILKNSEALLEFVANGDEIEPSEIHPELIEIHSGTKENDLYRFLTMYWSVPVSQGYGRRLRFLVKDKQNGKMIGLFGLTDPVFNLRVRDNWIGWTLEQRKRNLRSVMDAFVLGAIPPYSHLLGGKLVCTLLSSSEVRGVYHNKYSTQKSVIKGRIHDNDLLLLTTTSALGKSSLYDRIRMNRRTYFYSVGGTEGYGHFHIPQRIFDEMRYLLQLMNHPYATKNRFGHGPNWRMRVIRVALKECGFNAHLLKHQIKRESFMIPLARNSKLCLREKSSRPVYYNGDVSEITEKALRRWVIPRAKREPSYRTWDRIEFLRSIINMIQ
ncbi:MAG: Druantia anti-phage system protein DruA [Candidatus Thorarchaeota archaeon]|jgi:hypothetical protein